MNKAAFLRIDFFSKSDDHALNIVGIFTQYRICLPSGQYGSNKVATFQTKSFYLIVQIHGNI